MLSDIPQSVSSGKFAKPTNSLILSSKMKLFKGKFKRKIIKSGLSNPGIIR